ncbi:MAG: ABC transporter ATP-binding protein [Deltaproteobacteria bacterium HGW-Deltaproteobacteria-8]|nr:MAG: ABC transporter ATP-binding protein [Deltaproteobacteria bacterium HGW-Deltaproteobacteria-8]
MLTLRFILKNLFRHKLRNSLTIVGIAVSVLSFGLLRTTVDAWYAGVEASSATRLVTRNSISLMFTLPVSYEERIRAVDGVTIVSRGNWFGGVYIDEKDFFPNFAVDARTYLTLYPEIQLNEDQKTAFLRDRKGCIIGVKLARRFGWKIGDPVTLKGTIYPGNWGMTVRGIYTGRDKGTDETQLMFHWDYLNETLKKSSPRRADQVGFFMIGVANADVAAITALAIDARFQNSLAETLTETEKAFQMGFVAMSGAIVAAIRIVSMLVIVIIMAVAANTMAMSARERLGEFAALKALGFGGGYLALLILGESMALASIGCALGCALTFPAASAFGSAVSQFFPIFQVSTLTVTLQGASALVVGLVAGIVPAWRAQRIGIAEALRRIA